jgi:uncharacterized protein (TIGR02118 family)
MIKRLTQWSPREATSREDALRYWREEHAQLLERVPGVTRYVQNHCIPGPDGAEPPYAGLGEVWFESLAAVQTATQSAEWRAVLADAATFMDIERISAAWAEEHAVF